MTGTGASYAVAGAERSSAVLKHDNWPNAELALCASRPNAAARRVFVYAAHKVFSSGCCVGLNISLYPIEQPSK